MAQKRRDNQGIIQKTITVDGVTDIAAKVVMRKEGVSYSAAICALATSAALQDESCMAEIRLWLLERVGDKLTKEGWHPGLSASLSREIITGHKEVLRWN